ncbi:MAG: efflux RND transporter periplasmic adaptor subunit [Proteobacteria bacterium]|uniref:efflux RND transporter periplasmic adaptor subunit n=1 Tax=Aquabacterium sp. TaxID=1872578 RepID=UPI0035C661FD|nr:efflux RND transporter periplasmic adaptor subunit [Pseudomonadota bacterium]
MPALRFVFALFTAALLTACSERASVPPAGAPASGVSLTQQQQRYLRIEQIGPGGASLSLPWPARVAFRPQGLVAMGSPLGGRVAAIHVQPGQAVQAGAVLLTLQSADAASARANLTLASVKLTTAEDALRRQDELLKKGVGIEAERFAAEMAVREARASLEGARRAAGASASGQGDRFELRAPVDGMVLTVAAHVGAMAGPDSGALVEIGDPRQLWVVADVPASDVAGVRVGQSAEVRQAGAAQGWQAQVEGVGSVVDDQRRMPVYLALKAPQALPKPGALLEAQVHLPASTQLSLPVTAVLIKGGRQHVVYVQSGHGRYEARPVAVGTSKGGRVLILDGLREGDRVVTEGALLLDAEAEQLL